LGVFAICPAPVGVGDRLGCPAACRCLRSPQWSRPGSGGCSTGPASSAVSSPAPASAWRRFCIPAL